MKHIFLIASFALLIGCERTQRIVEKPTIVDRPELILPVVQPAEQYDFEWIVVTKQNFNEVVKEMEERGQTVVLFAVSPQGYQNLSLNMAELRRFIIQQQSVIIAYKKYYGNDKGN